MPFDIQPVHLRFPEFDECDSSYTCLRPSTSGAICMDSAVIMRGVATMAEICMKEDIENRRPEGGKNLVGMEAPIPERREVCSAILDGGFAFAAAGAISSSLPGFRIEDSIREDERCFVLDWDNVRQMREDAPLIESEWVTATYSALDAIMADETQSKPGVVFCGKDSVSVNHLITSTAIEVSSALGWN